MSLLVCSGCSTRYAPGSPACPHCGGVEAVEEGTAVSPGPLLPFLDLSCTTGGSAAGGVARRGFPRPPTPGAPERPAYLCSGCGAVMREEEAMPKISRLGGATNAAADREREGDGRPPASDVCSNCGKPYSESACGISHAMVAHERKHQLDAPSEGDQVPADGTRSAEDADDSTGGEESSPGSSSSTSAAKPKNSA